MQTEVGAVGSAVGSAGSGMSLPFIQSGGLQAGAVFAHAISTSGPIWKDVETCFLVMTTWGQGK